MNIYIYLLTYLLKGQEPQEEQQGKSKQNGKPKLNPITDCTRHASGVNDTIKMQKLSE